MYNTLTIFFGCLYSIHVSSITTAIAAIISKTKMCLHKTLKLSYKKMDL